MDSASDEILPHAAFPSDEHRRVGIGHAVDDGADLLHPEVAAEQRSVTDRAIYIVLRYGWLRRIGKTCSHLST